MTRRRPSPPRTKHPPPLEQRVFAALVRAQDHLMHQMACLLKAQGLSEPQYNVLRILRGAGAEGLACQGIAERMLTRVPDVTRLLDRLERAGYVTRERGIAADRRLVVTRVTGKALRLLARLDGPVLALHREQFRPMTRRELRELERLLETARGERRETRP